MSTPLPSLPHPPANHAPIINYSLTYNQIGPIQPTYNHPYGMSSNYPAYGYQNPYQQIPNVNPYSAYQQTSYPQYTQNYPSQYNAGYNNAYQSSQQKYDPNALAGVSINMKADLL